MKNQKDSKEPPKADLDRFGVARSSKMRSKMTPKWSSKVKKLIFAKVHISSALPIREGSRDLKKSSKIIKKTLNFMMKTNMRKKVPSETDFWWFWPHFGVSWGPGGSQKCKKKASGGYQKKTWKKSVGKIIGRQLERCKKGPSIYQYIWLVLLHPSSSSSVALIRVSSHTVVIAAASRSQRDPWCPTNTHSKT